MGRDFILTESDRRTHFACIRLSGYRDHIATKAKLQLN
ncbi:hypothetical protein EVA_17856 [gut metagenome]|uniref:Uncharacterized protein n=1 Tax=gut metagenome TaxID=749906 RepID=J9FI13_9ZZZZ